MTRWQAKVVIVPTHLVVSAGELQMLREPEMSVRRGRIGIR